MDDQALSWEDIDANIASLQAINERTNDGRPPTTQYLHEIQQVNHALQQGAQLSIDIAQHGFVAPLGEGGFAQGEGCVLVLRKVVVTFEQRTSTRYSANVLLLWRDITHESDRTWEATWLQPQWEKIVQQAQAFQQAHPALNEEQEAQDEERKKEDR